MPPGLGHRWEPGLSLDRVLGLFWSAGRSYWPILWKVLMCFFIFMELVQYFGVHVEIACWYEILWFGRLTWTLRNTIVYSSQGCFDRGLSLVKKNSINKDFCIILSVFYVDESLFSIFFMYFFLQIIEIRCYNNIWYRVLSTYFYYFHQIGMELDDLIKKYYASLLLKRQLIIVNKRAESYSLRYSVWLKPCLKFMFCVAAI